MATIEQSPSPRKIEPSGSHELFILWSDGSGFTIPYVEVRFQCPCAGCVDEHTGERTLRRESIRPDIRPTGVQPVGRYAIQLNWSDGHSSGLFHYDRLYKICQSHGKNTGPQP